MALTVTLVDRLSLGNRRGAVIDVDFDDSYPTGGETLTPEDCGLTSIDALIPETKAGYLVRYDRANEKLMVYVGDNDAGADGPLAQVADTTDLNPAIADLRCIVIGL